MPSPFQSFHPGQRWARMLIAAYVLCGVALALLALLAWLVFRPD